MGNDNVQAFLKQCRGIPGWDFAKWLKEQPEQSNEEIVADIMRSQELDEPMVAKLEG